MEDKTRAEREVKRGGTGWLAGWLVGEVEEDCGESSLPFGVEDRKGGQRAKLVLSLSRTTNVRSST